MNNDFSRHHNFSEHQGFKEKTLGKKQTGIARRGFVCALNAAKFGASVPTISVGTIRYKFSIQKYAK
jgi:hypothetical protein